MIFSFLFGQKGSITGKVTDSTNDSPLIGANVIIDGTDQGAPQTLRENTRSKD